MIIETNDGSHSVFSEEFGVSYHSKHGAIQETEHVFINAGLRLKAIIQQDIHILEIGFGTGLNAFMTYLEAKRRNLNIHYIGVEAFPIDIKMVEQLNYTTLLKATSALPQFLQLHQSTTNTLTSISDNFLFTRLEQTFETLDFNSQFDIIYYDAFAPTSQPTLWEAPILQKMYNALKPEGVLVTYCAKGSFKRTLKAIGFKVEALPGPPGKREMTRASKLVE